MPPQRLMTAEYSQRRDASPYEGHRLVALGRRVRRKMAFTAGVHTALAGGGRVAFSTMVALRSCLLWNYNPCCSIEPRVEGRWLSAIPLCACEDVEYHVACPRVVCAPFAVCCARDLCSRGRHVDARGGGGRVLRVDARSGVSPTRVPRPHATRYGSGLVAV